VLKADVPGIVHKSDVGAVELDLRGEADVRCAHGRPAARFGDRLGGVLVQPMTRGGVEVLCGIVQEPVFGPLIVFGLGGVATEVLGDRSARLAPLTDVDAAELIGSVRIVPPTSQNQAAIEDDMREVVQARLDLDDAALTAVCERAIRNYDPCISCAAHFLDLTVERA
jgi:hypothetical protein